LLGACSLPVRRDAGTETRSREGEDTMRGLWLDCLLIACSLLVPWLGMWTDHFGRSGVQVFGRSGVQAFRCSGVQAFGRGRCRYFVCQTILSRYCGGWRENWRSAAVEDSRRLKPRLQSGRAPGRSGPAAVVVGQLEARQTSDLT